MKKWYLTDVTEYNVKSQNSPKWEGEQNQNIAYLLYKFGVAVVFTKDGETVNGYIALPAINDTKIKVVYLKEGRTRSTYITADSIVTMRVEEVVVTLRGNPLIDVSHRVRTGKDAAQIVHVIEETGQHPLNVGYSLPTSKVIEAILKR